jgi:hypothetical protein
MGIARQPTTISRGKILMNFAVLVVGFLLPGLAFAQFNIDRPELGPGDSWTWVSKDSVARTNSKSTREITAKENDHYATRITYEKDGRVTSSTSGLSLDLNRLRRVQGQVTDSGWFNFPLTQGKSWQAKEPWPDGNGYVTLTYTVGDTEQVTVPAGTVESIKVIGKGRWFNTTTKGEDVTEVTIWYAPSVRGIVRYHERRWLRGAIGFDVTDELVSYRLAVAPTEK